MVRARFGGATARQQAEAADALLRAAGLDVELAVEDESLWQAQRDAQRSPAGLVVRVSALQTDLEGLADAAERFGATLVGRAGLGLFWLRLDEGDFAGLLASLRPRFVSAVLDRPAGMAFEPPEPRDSGAALLAGRVKERFDPDGTLV
jgi:glycolate oxidase FAD binding subunit